MDRDLIEDTGNIRDTTNQEYDFIYEQMEELKIECDWYHDYADKIFLLGRQYERNQNKK